MEKSMSETQAATNRTFRVGLRAQTGVYFPKADTLTLKNYPSDSGLIDLIFSVMRFQPEDFKHPVRFGLWVDVSGPAESMDAAVETFGNVARGMAAILSFTANAAIQDPTADVAFETTPGCETREFWTREKPRLDWPKGLGRGILTQLPELVIQAWCGQPEKERERLSRAIVQYHHAVQNWIPGSEIAALSHIWIGMEALTKVFRDRRQVELGLNLEQLIGRYSAERSTELGKTFELSGLNALDGEIRRRHFFQGDDGLYKIAKEASDAYEHSFSPLWAVREKAVKALEPAGAYLREAILDLLDLDDRVKRALTSPLFSQPYNDMMDISLHGELKGPSGALETVEDYPDIDVFSEQFQLTVDSEEDAVIGNRSRIAALGLPTGVSFKPSSMDITASLSVTEGTELLTGKSQAGLIESSATAWEQTSKDGRSVSSTRFGELLGEPIRTEWTPGISFDESIEYRVEITKMPESGVDQADLLRSAERVKEERVLEGWEPVCALPVIDARSVSILYRKAANPD